MEESISAGALGAPRGASSACVFAFVLHHILFEALQKFTLSNGTDNQSRYSVVIKNIKHFAAGAGFGGRHWCRPLHRHPSAGASTGAGISRTAESG